MKNQILIILLSEKIHYWLEWELNVYFLLAVMLYQNKIINIDD
jgi:hypothetical protein